VGWIGRKGFGVRAKTLENLAAKKKLVRKFGPKILSARLTRPSSWTECMAKRAAPKVTPTQTKPVPLSPRVRPQLPAAAVWVSAAVAGVLILAAAVPWLARMTPPGIDGEAVLRFSNGQIPAPASANSSRGIDASQNQNESECPDACSGLVCPWDGWEAGRSPTDACDCICVRLKAVTEWDLDRMKRRREREEETARARASGVVAGAWDPCESGAATAAPGSGDGAAARSSADATEGEASVARAEG